MPTWWILLFALRMAWTLYGQTGYLHPDEFFQSPEVMAGDVLDLDVHRTWEFNRTSPVRSVVLPGMTSGIAFLLLGLTEKWIGQNLVTAHVLLVLPRLLITILSGVTDIMVFRLSGAPGLLLYATSYVTTVFYTRTLSNSLEAFLFVALIHFVICDKNEQAVNSSNKALRALNEQARALEKKHSGCKDRKSWYKKVKPPSTLDLSLDTECEVQTCFSDVVWLSVIIAAGIFNRPSFLIFAFAPYMFWVFSACGSRDHHITTHTLDRAAFSMAITAFIVLLFIICDSVYYGTLNPRNLIGIYRKFLVVKEMQTFLKSLTITPFNFVMYNINPRNLAQHGLHPRMLHLAVNAPMLFGILAVFPLYNIGKIIEARVGINKKLRWGTVNKTHKFLLFSYCVPLALLSVFPHQEPRFLIPLLAPLALLYGKRVFGWTAWRPWAVVWIVPNVLCAIFFGVLHQGGLIPCLENLQQHLVGPHQASPHHATHILFYHTYMPPRHLLAINKTAAISTSHTLKVHDLQGADLDSLHKVLDNISVTVEKQAHCVIKIVSPSTLDYQFCEKYKDFSFKLVDMFPCHVSMENPPALPDDLTCKRADVTSCNRPCSAATYLERARTTFSLFMYDVVSNVGSAPK